MHPYTIPRADDDSTDFNVKSTLEARYFKAYLHWLANQRQTEPPAVAYGLTPTRAATIRVTARSIARSLLHVSVNRRRWEA
jgi:hypothetical protein